MSVIVVVCKDSFSSSNSKSTWHKSRRIGLQMGRHIVVVVVVVVVGVVSAGGVVGGFR